MDVAALADARRELGASMDALVAIRNAPFPRVLSATAQNTAWRAHVRLLVALGRMLAEASSAGCEGVKCLPDRTLLSRDDRQGWQVVAPPVPATSTTPATNLFAWLGLDVGHVPERGQNTRLLRAPLQLATFENARQRVCARTQQLLERGGVRDADSNPISGERPLDGLDLRSIRLPANLAWHALVDVNLAGQDMSALRLRGATFRHCDLRATLLPRELCGVHLLDCDLRGARIDRLADRTDSATAWPDLADAALTGAVIDASGTLPDGLQPGVREAGELLDARLLGDERSLLCSLNTIADTDVRRDAVERLANAVRAWLQRQPAGTRLLDALFGEYGGGQPEARHRYAAALAAMIFEAAYSSVPPPPGIGWLRTELACELAEHARAYSDSGAAHAAPPRTLTAQVAHALRQPAFPAAMRALALHLNPDLARIQGEAGNQDLTDLADTATAR